MYFFIFASCEPLRFVHTSNLAIAVPFTICYNTKLITAFQVKSISIYCDITDSAEPQYITVLCVQFYNTMRWQHKIQNNIRSNQGGVSRKIAKLLKVHMYAFFMNKDVKITHHVGTMDIVISLFLCKNVLAGSNIVALTLNIVSWKMIALLKGSIFPLFTLRISHLTKRCAS